MESNRVDLVAAFLSVPCSPPKTLMYVCKDRDSCARVRTEISRRLDGQLKVATITKLVANNGNTVLLISAASSYTMCGLRANAVILDDFPMTEELAHELRCRIRP